MPVEDTPMLKLDYGSQWVVYLQSTKFFMKSIYLGSIAFYSLLSGESFMPINAPLGIFLLNEMRHLMAMKFLFNV